MRFISSNMLERFPHIVHAFFTRKGGVSTGAFGSLNGSFGSQDQPARVRENRRRMAYDLGVEPENLLGLNQMHNSTVVVVKTPWKEGCRPNADALVTKQYGIALSVSYADCGPLIIADPKREVIGIAHVGWRGVCAGIIRSVIGVMEAEGAKRENLIAVLGPTISRNKLEVDQPVFSRFVNKRRSNEAFFSAEDHHGHRLLDLPALIAEQIAHEGVPKFHDLAICTYEKNDLFFSARRARDSGQKQYGHQIGAVSLKET